MPLNLPSLPTLRERIANDIERWVTNDNGNPVDAHNAGTGYTELANVVAGVAHGLYGNQQWIAEQIFVLTADDELLLTRAAERGVYQIAAAFATGTATASGNNGVVIPVATVLQHSDGRQYRTTAEATISGGTANLPLIALEAGVNSQLTAAELSFISPITGVDGDVTNATVSGGADIEPVSRVRERLAEVLQYPPLGGRRYDYVQWAKQGHVDVTRAWPFFHESGIGSVVVRFVNEDLADPIPTQAHIDAVTAYMETVRPAGTRSFSVEAPTAVPLVITFTSLTPNTTEVQQAIEAEVRDLLRRESAPDSTLLLSHIREAISNATGEQDFVIDLTSNITTSSSEFIVFGGIVWPGA